MNNIPLKRTIKQLKRTKKQLKRTVKQLKRTIKQLELTGFETVGRGDSIYQNWLKLQKNIPRIARLVATPVLPDPTRQNPSESPCTVISVQVQVQCVYRVIPTKSKTSRDDCT